VTKAYYKGAVGALLVFDLTDRTTFENIEKRWYNDVKDNAEN
jgi:Ras-related protein Rab-11A